MATTKNLQTLLMITIITLSSLTLAISASDDQYTKTLDPKELGLKRREKLTHLHFYFHDVINGPNPTAVRVAGPQLMSNSTNFGFVAMIDDPLTAGPEPTSKRIGSAQGLYGSASQTEVGLLMVLNYVFTEGKFNGSTLSILGRNAILSEVREMPIVGGSGVFRFARGFALAKTYKFNATSLDAIVEYNVYVLHY